MICMDDGCRGAHAPEIHAGRAGRGARGHVGRRTGRCRARRTHPLTHTPTHTMATCHSASDAPHDAWGAPAACVILRPPHCTHTDASAAPRRSTTYTYIYGTPKHAHNTRHEAHTPRTHTPTFSPPVRPARPAPRPMPPARTSPHASDAPSRPHTRNYTPRNARRADRHERAAPRPTPTSRTPPAAYATHTRTAPTPPYPTQHSITHPHVSATSACWRVGFWTARRLQRSGARPMLSMHARSSVDGEMAFIHRCRRRCANFFPNLLVGFRAEESASRASEHLTGTPATVVAQGVRVRGRKTSFRADTGSYNVGHICGQVLGLAHGVLVCARAARRVERAVEYEWWCGRGSQCGSRTLSKRISFDVQQKPGRVERALQCPFAPGSEDGTAARGESRRWGCGRDEHFRDLGARRGRRAIRYRHTHRGLRDCGSFVRGCHARARAWCGGKHGAAEGRRRLAAGWKQCERFKWGARKRRPQAPGEWARRAEGNSESKCPSPYRRRASGARWL